MSAFAKYLLPLIAIPQLSFAEESVPRPEPDAKIVIMDDAALELIDPDTPITILAEGFRWSEGPVWDAVNNRLLFTDVPNNIAHSWSEDGGLETFLEPSGYSGITSKNNGGANGLAFDANGDLISCEHGDRRVSRLTEHGGKITIADRWEGKRFSSPNDLALASDGTIYFTDPPYGLAGNEKSPDYQAGLNGVYRITPDETVTCEVKDLHRPNGICLSVDEETVYVAQSHGEAPHIYAYPRNDDGSLGEGALFFDVSPHSDLGGGAPDGLRVDERGNVWTTGPGGVLIISPEGNLLAAIQAGSRVANLCWGNDGQTLYLTAHKRLLRLQTKVKAARMGR